MRMLIGGGHFLSARRDASAGVDEMHCQLFPRINDAKAFYKLTTLYAGVK